MKSKLKGVVRAQILANSLGHNRTNAEVQHSRKNAALLEEIFPPHIADALREGRRVPQEKHECVTIFFSDIVGFSAMSRDLSPEKVADLLDRLYAWIFVFYLVPLLCMFRCFARHFDAAIVGNMRGRNIQQRHHSRERMHLEHRPMGSF